jgi:hypothetical protein
MQVFVKIHLGAAKFTWALRNSLGRCEIHLGAAKFTWALKEQRRPEVTRIGLLILLVRRSSVQLVSLRARQFGQTE